MAVESSMKDEDNMYRETPGPCIRKNNEGTSLNAWIHTNNDGRLVAPVGIRSLIPQGSSTEEMLIIREVSKERE